MVSIFDPGLGGVLQDIIFFWSWILAILQITLLINCQRECLVLFRQDMVGMGVLDQNMVLSFNSFGLALVGLVIAWLVGHLLLFLQMWMLHFVFAMVDYSVCSWVSLVSVAIDIGISSKNFMLDFRLMGYYLTAFERFCQSMSSTLGTLLCFGAMVLVYFRVCTSYFWSCGARLYASSSGSFLVLVASSALFLVSAASSVFLPALFPVLFLSIDVLVFASNTLSVTPLTITFALPLIMASWSSHRAFYFCYAGFLLLHQDSCVYTPSRLLRGPIRNCINLKMDETMKKFQEGLIVLETKAEHLLLARHQLVENDRVRNGNREELTALRKRARMTKTSVPSPFESIMRDIGGPESKPLVKEVCTTCGDHDPNERTWMMSPGTDLIGRIPFHATHTILETGKNIVALPICMPHDLGCKFRDFLVREVHMSGLSGNFECNKTIEELEHNRESKRLVYVGGLVYNRKFKGIQVHVRDFLMREVHVGGLTGNFGCNKTIEELEHNFTSPALSEMSPR
uniref:P53 and DNA damage-regulated protein 1 n=1 Tax=Quercus lobata TaxID=97700 RepID=A0A7N2LFK3_QUELO